jgi:putative hemolysin
MAELGHLPQIGESVDVDGYRLTVAELDGRRVARVRVSRLQPITPVAGPPEGSVVQRLDQ